MKCKICNTENKSCFSEKILGKYQIDYYQCSNCRFVQTEEPFWLEEAYLESINLSDTGYMVRNLFYVKRLTILLTLLFGNKGKYLDCAGGYGVFVRLMRDIGFDFYWDDKFTKNLFSVGFEKRKEKGFNAITLFEAFEHFVEPMKEIESLLKISKTIIFSTDLYPQPLPKPTDWWYYGLDHGQHISFYSEDTFEYISRKLGIHYNRVGSLHILSTKDIPKWKLFAVRFSKFGLQILTAKKMKSKTWDDYCKMSESSNK